MIIGVITVTFNEPEFIVPCIKQFDGFNFPHIVLVSKKPWRGDYSMDNTWALSQMHNKYGDTIVDYWPDQATQFNFGLELLQKEKVDWALIVDTDEFYTSIDIGRLVGQIRYTQADVLTCSDMFVYWKNPNYLILPKQNDNPIIAVKTNQRFSNKRSIDDFCLKIHSSAEMHHMSYVRTDEQMKKKIETFEHSHEFDTNKWYNDVWIPWTLESKNLHPTMTNKFSRAIYHPAPEEIRRIIQWN